MIFLFFMITDPKTVPGGRVGRVAFGTLVAVASVLVMATQSDEFGTKVALLGGLVIMCAARPLIDRLVPVNSVPYHVNTSTLPAITVGQDVIDFDHTLAGAGIQPVLVTLGQNLEIENQALLRRDEALLEAVDHGDRLIQMQTALSDAQASGTTTVRHYQFDTVNVKLLVPFGKQTGLSLGFVSTGTVTVESYDSAGNLTSLERATVQHHVRRSPRDRGALAERRGTTSAELAPRLLGNRPERDLEDALVARPSEHEQDRLSDILRAHHARQLGHVRRSAAAHREVGRHTARADVRAAHALGAQLMIERRGQAHLGELGRAVDRLVGQAAPAGLAGDRHEVGRVALEQRRQCRAVGVDQALDVDVDHLLDLLRGQVEERPVAADAGVADDDVELPEAGHGGVDDRLDLGRVTDVAGLHERAFDARVLPAP
jgi:hypothetical protein